jgi:DNA-binding response OmpR family regulator
VGTRFRVVLPLPTPAEAAGARPSAADESARRPLDILMLTADREDAAFLTAFLGARGHAVLEARDAVHALRLAAGAGVDVVIADLRATGGDGAALRGLRALPACAGARCIVTVPPAADGSRAPTVPPAALGDCVVLATPYEIDELRRAVEGE